MVQSDTLKEGLLFWNPWWEDGDELFEGIEDRQSAQHIEPLFERKEVLVLTGVRRCGKTTMMHLYVKKLLENKEPGQIMYINLDDPSFEEVSLRDIYRGYEELMTPEDEQYLFLDEVQNKPGWEKWVKKMYDSRKDLKIAVSGSNSSLLKREFGTYLVGRNLSYEVNPLSFPEYLAFKGLNINTEVRILSERAAIIHHLESYLKFGGYPEVVLEDHEKMKFNLLKEYFLDILARDVLTRYEVKEQRKLEKLAVYLITNTACEVSAKSLSKIVNLNIKTVQEYLDHLEEVYLFFLVNHFSYSLKAQLTYPRKVYCIDCGMKNAVSFSFSKDMGHLMENLVYLKLRKEGEVYYWRDRTAGIDFVLKQGDNIVQLIQSCYDLSHEKTKKREIRGLLRAMDNFNMEEGTIITWDHEGTEEFDEKIIRYQPLWRWLLEDVKNHGVA